MDNGTIVCTLCFLVAKGRILLARKMKKLIIGCWNGYGGRQEAGDQSLRYTAVREVLEKTGGGIVIDPADLNHMAIVHFYTCDGDGVPIIVHVFLVKRWVGEAKSTDEMATSTWFTLDNLPWGEMAPGDPYWLPLVLAGNKVVAHIAYGPGQKYLFCEPKVMKVENFPED